ncbi:ABC transporter substrate-binding protein [Amycolatopsis ultiminotia]|uniref:ABC transporter substrate-binding protein n=1 Tax=Amycolatopsis ultiminotia TaxID=543629 RepID=A0ABP6YKC7_9PSEU
MTSQDGTFRRSWRQRTAVFAGLAVAASGLAGCGFSSRAVVPGAVVVAIYESEVTDVLPGMSQGSDLDYALFTPLTRYDPRARKLTDEVAQSITTEDQQHWRIRIKRGWTFHDGSPVTARSFADSWNTTADPANVMTNNAEMSVFAGYAEMNPPDGEKKGRQPVTALSGVHVVDDYALDVTLSAPNRLLPYQLSSTAFAPITPAAAADPKKFATRPVGNGPFRAANGGWELGEQDIALERYPGYAGRPAGLANVDLRVYQSAGTLFTDFQADQIDVAFLDGDEFSVAADEEPGDLVDAALPSLVYLGFPLYDKRFANAGIRRAISLAIDRKSIVDGLLEGDGSVADGLGPAMLAGAEKVRCPCGYDPGAARAALRAAGGWQGELVLQTYAGPETERVLQAIANQLHDNLGIDARIETVPISQLYEGLDSHSAKGPFMLYSGAAYPHVYAQVKALLSKDGELNMTTFADPEFQHDLAAAGAAGTDARAGTLAAQAASVGLGKIPLTPLYYPKAGILHESGITGVVPELLGAPNLASLRKP